MNLDVDLQEKVDEAAQSDSVDGKDFIIIELLACQVQEYRKFNDNLLKLIEKVSKK